MPVIRHLNRARAALASLTIPRSRELFVRW